jgi:hypothetical protein
MGNRIAPINAATMAQMLVEMPEGIVLIMGG